LQRVPGNAGTAAVVQRDKDKEKLAEIESILKATSVGQEAWALKEKYKVGVKFKSGQGTFYDGSPNTMVIDSTYSPARAALSFVHEMNHAEAKHKGTSANAGKLSRESYIKTQVEEEANGVVKSIEMKIELKGTKIDISKASYPGEEEYGKAYNAAVMLFAKDVDFGFGGDDTVGYRTGANRDSRISLHEINRLAKDAGRKKVIEMFMDGTFKTSTSKESYPDYYGKYWDKANSGKK
jgi:hypothetical protein